jgi:hypothetical protein
MALIMAFRWTWMRKRYGRDIPAFKIRIEHALDLTQVEGLLLTWAVERPEWVGTGTEARHFPASVSLAEVEEIVRDQLRWGGTGAFEASWDGEMTRREIDQARDWAGMILKELFPKEFALTWSEGI